METTGKHYIVKVKRLNVYWTGKNLSKNIQDSKVFDSFCDAVKGVERAMEFTKRNYCIKEVEYY